MTAAKAAPPIFLLHGFTGASRAWGEGLLEGLGRKARVIAIDLPGHGENVGFGPRGVAPGRDTPHAAAAPSFEEVLEGVVGELDARGVDRADWVGYSMGGRLALAAALLHPERVHRLVLESASPGLDSPEERAERRRRDEALARRIEERGVEAFVREWMALPLFASQRQLPPPVLERARRLRLANDAGGLALALRSYGTGVQPEFWGRLPELEARTLLLTGALDRKFEEIADRMETAVPHARWASVPGAGHTVHLEAPERWLTAVTGFLRRDEAR